jgi:streptogramin lyase
MKSVTLLLTLVSSLSWAHPGTGIVMDTRGNVFYTDLEQVWKINKQGIKSIAVRHVHTHELYLDEQDNLFGEHLWYDGSADQWGHYVWRLAADGVLEKIIPETEGFLENYSFVRDHRGNMYWADRRFACQKIARKNRDGSISNLGDQCFQNIRKIISDKNGLVYVMDFQDVKRLDQQGKVSNIASKIANKRWVQANPENQNAVMGIWIDVDGNVYAAIYSSRQVKRFTENGIEEVVLQTSKPWAPSGGMVTPDGELWVLETSDTNEVRVERILKDKRRFIY